MYAVKNADSLKNSEYVRFHFHGILGFKGSLVTMYGDISQKFSWYIITLCIDIPKFRNGKFITIYLRDIIFFVEAS